MDDKRVKEILLFMKSCIAEKRKHPILCKSFDQWQFSNKEYCKDMETALFIAIRRMDERDS